MTPDYRRQVQMINHDPENDQWGDCYRTCIAMLLNVPANGVPHFCDGQPKDELDIGVDQCRKWLKDFGLNLFLVNYPGTGSLQELLDTLKLVAPLTPVILGGETSRGTGHVVVVYDGEIWCDPLTGTSEHTLVGPNLFPDGGQYWTVEIIVKGWD